MKVLHLAKFYPPYMGGIETFIRDLISETIHQAPQSKVDVLAFSLDGDSEIPLGVNARLYLRKVNVTVKRQQFSRSYLLTYLRIYKQYDIVHLHFPNIFAMGLANSFRPKRLVVHWHSDIVRQKTLLKAITPAVNAMCRQALQIYATSPSYGDGSSFLRRFREKQVVLPLGLDESRINSEADPAQRLSGRLAQFEHAPPFRLLTVGRHVYYKGFDVLLHALSQLSPAYSLTITGHGPLTKQLKSLAVDLGLTERVNFVGLVSKQHLDALFREATVFVLPSVERSEAFGMVQIEAMSMALPVVSTDIPGSGVGWVNRDAFSGKVVGANDAGALVDGIVEVTEGGNYEHYASGALSRFTDHFKIAKVTETLGEHYATLLASDPS